MLHHTPRHLACDCVWIMLSSTSTLCEVNGPLENVTASVLLAFKESEFAAQKYLTQLPCTLAALRELAIAHMSSACAVEPTSKPNKCTPWPVASSCFRRESITMMKSVGDRTDPCFTPRFTGSYLKMCFPALLCSLSQCTSSSSTGNIFH